MLNNVSVNTNLNESCIFEYGMSSGTLFWLFLDGVLFVVIVCGNIVTIYVLKTSSQFSPPVSNQFVLSLALSDMLVGLTLPYHMAFYVAPYLATLKHTCILKFVFILFACCASILNVTAIAGDRYFAIMHPFRYERIMNNKMARTILCCGWFHAVIFSTIPLYWNRWKLCEPCELGRVLPRYYTTAVITPAFCTVWTVMFFIYWRIWRQTVHQVNKMRKFNICKLRKSCFQVVLLIMGCFTLCWLPFLVAACIQAGGYHSMISPMAYKVVLSLAISSSAINPLIYAWKNREFKRTFGHMVRCRTASHSVQQDRNSTDKNPSVHRNSGQFELQISV